MGWEIRIDPDFREALPVLLGEDAAGLSPTSITRFTACWEDEYRAFQEGDLSAEAKGAFPISRSSV